MLTGSGYGAFDICTAPPACQKHLTIQILHHAVTVSSVLLLNQLSVFAISWIEQDDPAISGPCLHPAHGQKNDCSLFHVSWLSLPLNMCFMAALIIAL